MQGHTPEADVVLFKHITGLFCSWSAGHLYKSVVIFFVHAYLQNQPWSVSSYLGNLLQTKSAASITHSASLILFKVSRTNTDSIEHIFIFAAA